MTPERKEKLEKAAAGRQAGFILVLEDIHDPHNASAILRTCDAFGVQDVCLIFEREEEFDPAEIGRNSSSSAHKWLSFRTFAKARDALKALREDGYTLLATAPQEGSRDPYATDLTLPKVALLLGNEHRGLSQKLLRAADITLAIPMRGMVESLNVSVVAALLIGEITRQRLAKGMDVSRSEEEKARIFKDFEDR